MKTWIAATLIAVATPAMAENIYCEIAEVGPRAGYFGSDIWFVLDRDAGTVRVADGIIQTELKKDDLAAKVAEITDNRFVATWAVDMTNSSVQSTRMTYRATYRFGEKTVMIRAVPTGYDNEFMARGTCEIK